MLDINLLRNDPEKVKENIRKKFQDQKLVLVDEVRGAGQGIPRGHASRRTALRDQRNDAFQADRRPDGQGPEGRG